jgi:hypothetical protein
MESQQQTNPTVVSYRQRQEAWGRYLHPHLHRCLWQGRWREAARRSEGRLCWAQGLGWSGVPDLSWAHPQLYIQGEAHGRQGNKRRPK